MRLCRALVLLLVAALAVQCAAGQTPPRSAVLCYTAHDDDYLYLAATVRKPTLQGDRSAPFADVLKDDCLALYAASADGKTLVMMAVSVAGGAQIYRGSNAAGLGGFDDFRLAPDGSRIPFRYYVNHIGDMNRAGGGESYTVEMALPWIELGGSPPTGSRMAINVAALSAAGDTTSLLSLAPRVQSPADAWKVDLWTDLLLAPAAPQAVGAKRVCPKVGKRAPNMDGLLDKDEWPAASEITMVEREGGGATSVAPSLVAARTGSAPKAVAAPAPAPNPVPGAPRVADAAALKLPKMVWSVYLVEWQGDPRKGLPLRSTRAPSGATLVATHPLDGEGPWLSSDSVEMHRRDMVRMRDSGIDALAVRLPLADTDARRLALRGVLALGAAQRWLAGRREMVVPAAPLVDVGSGAAVNLTDPAEQARVVDIVRAFATRLPRLGRAHVPVAGAPTASVLPIFLAGGIAPGSLTKAAAQALREAVWRATGCDTVLCAAADAGDGATALLPGPDGTTAAGPITVARMRPEALGEAGIDGFRTAWRSQAQGRAHWILLESWNDFEAGTAVAPTLEFGAALLDATAAWARAWHGPQGLRAEALQTTAPATVGAGALALLDITLRNSGSVAITAANHRLATRWIGPNDQAASAAETAPIPADIDPFQSRPQRLAVRAPAGAGEWRLEVALQPSAGASTSVPIAVLPITVTSDKALRPTLLWTDLPAALEAGAATSVRAVLRNDGPEAWPAGTVVRARMGMNGPGGRVDSGLADASATLPAAVPAGAATEVTVLLATVTPVGRAAPTDDGMALQCPTVWWEVGAGQAATATTDADAVGIVDADVGAVFMNDYTPEQLPAAKRLMVPIGVRNAGAQTWRRDAVRLGYHWYYQDGVEALWEGETTPLPQDLAPGEQLPDLLAAVTAPPNDGSYWLVWDVKVGDTWQSTLPSARPYDIRVHPVTVIMGKLWMAELPLGPPSPGGKRRPAKPARPMELVCPPFAGPTVAADTLWLPSAGSGLSSSRAIAFRWPGSAPGMGDAVPFAGQRVEPANAAQSPAGTVIHLLASATKPGLTATVTLVFSDKSEQLISFPIGDGSNPGAGGGSVSFVSRAAGSLGKANDKRFAVYRYRFNLTEGKKLAAVVLSRSEGALLYAITVQKQ